MRRRDQRLDMGEIVDGLPGVVAARVPRDLAVDLHENRLCDQVAAGLCRRRHNLDSHADELREVVEVPVPGVPWSCAASADSRALSAFHVPAMSPRSRRFRAGADVTPAPSASASTAASFRLLPAARARARRALSMTGGMPRMVYCRHELYALQAPCASEGPSMAPFP